MMLEKKQYYVKSGDLERWVWAFDPINAACEAFDLARGGETLDPYFFYVSTRYIDDVEGLTKMGDKNIVNTLVDMVQTDEVLELNETDEFFEDIGNDEDWLSYG